MKLKGYFYTIRALLSIQYMKLNTKKEVLPPLRLQDIMAAVPDWEEQKKVLTELLQKKIDGELPRFGARIEVLDTWMEQLFQEGEQVARSLLPLGKNEVPYSPFNQLFLDTVLALHNSVPSQPPQPLVFT